MKNFILKIEDCIAILEFNQPDSKVNVLTSAAMEELLNVIHSLEAMKDVKGLCLISNKPDVFIAGADIKEIEKITLESDGRQKALMGQSVINAFERLPFPTLALINGACLGGGLELALACDYRIACFGDKVKIGLPEVNLGVIPGFGGTKRMSRLIGLRKTLELIIPGKLISPKEAYKIGLVDGLTTLNNLQKDGINFISSKSEKRKIFKPKVKGLFNKFLDNNYFGHAILKSQTKKKVIKNTKGFYPAPLKAIDVVVGNYADSLENSLKREADAFGKLVATQISKNLISLFFLQEKYKKDLPAGRQGKWVDANAQTINKCGLLGAGTMGGGIAQLFGSFGIPVRMKDLNYSALGNGLKSAKKIFDGALKRRKIKPYQAVMGMGLISPTLDFSGFSNCDLIIEAVVEDEAVKQKVFEELGGIANPNAILASNTSCIPIGNIARRTKNPSRAAGLHFFNPVNRMPLIEIIRSAQTADDVVASLVKITKRCGKIPIVVKDSWGFLINRLLIPSLLQAGFLLEEGEDFKKIDNVMLKFGMPMGPFELLDEIGLDVGYKVAHLLEQNIGVRMKVPDILKTIYDQKWLGKKTGKGFYVHNKGGKIPNSEVKGFLGLNKNEIPENEIINRIILSMLSEAVLCLEEKVCQNPSDIDIGMIMGAGFPPFRGGLLRYADSLDFNESITFLLQLKEKLGKEKFEPYAALLNFLNKNERFYKG